MPRAAIYARFSTDLQSDRSVDDQINLCRDFAQRSGFGIVDTYFDRARSGTSVFGRDGLLRLLDDARAGRFDTIIVEALDRLSRDQEDLAGIHKRMSFAGIEIVAVHDGKADALQVGIRGLVSALWLGDLKHKIRRGMTGVITDGRHAGGRAYGYRPTPGQPGMMQIDPDEAEVVRRIFREVIAGRLPREIAHDLNRDGILPPRGTAWNASTITGSAQRGNGLTRNALYAGRLVWNRVRMVRDPDTGKRVSRPNPEAEWKTADAPHLAIVDAETFEAAQGVTSGRAKRAREGGYVRRPKRILSGLLRCGQCGSGMSVHDQRAGVVRIRCSRASESGTCENRRRYRLDRIEAAVLSGLHGQLADPELLAEYVRAYREERRAETAALERDRGQHERRIAEIGGQLDRLMDALTRGTLPVETVEARFLPLDAERKRLQGLLHALPEPAAVELHPQAVSRYRAAVEDLAGRLAEGAGPDDVALHEAFRALVDRVVIHDRPDGGVDAEVIGHLSALLGQGAEAWGGGLVAEVRSNTYPAVSFGKFVA